MTQYGTPSADIVDGDWLDEGAAATLFAHIVPGTPGSIGAGDDATYIVSGDAPSGDAVALELSDIEDPEASSGHIMRWRRQKDTAGGATVNMAVQLREGYTGEGAQGSLINAYADDDIPDAFATATDTLSGAEADSITDYTDLQLRITATQV